MKRLVEAQNKGIKVPKKTVQSFKFDADAIAQGNFIMVDMNARLAKQEHLGVTSLWKQQQYLNCFHARKSGRESALGCE